MMEIILIILKSFFVGAGLIIFATSFFHARESRKIESRLNIALPYYLQTFLSLHIVIASIFVIMAMLLLFF